MKEGFHGTGVFRFVDVSSTVQLATLVIRYSANHHLFNSNAKAFPTVPHPKGTENALSYIFVTSSENPPQNNRFAS
jgi:hypothetical protein